MASTVRELAAMIHGEVCGKDDDVILAARPLSDARPGDITFVEDERYLAKFYASGAAGRHRFTLNMPVNGGDAGSRRREPLMAFINVVRSLHPRFEAVFDGIQPTALVHPTAHVDDDVAQSGPHAVIGEGCNINPCCRIHAGAIIGNYCDLGEDVTLHPHVVLYDGYILGKRVIVHRQRQSCSA